MGEEGIANLGIASLGKWRFFEDILCCLAPGHRWLGWPRVASVKEIHRGSK